MNKEKIKYNAIQIKEEVENLKKQNISMNGKNYFIENVSKFREDMMRDNLLNSLILERTIVDDYLVITFWIESNDPKMLIKNIKDQFDNFEITEEEMERCKKVWISSEVIMTANVEITVDHLINDIIEYGHIIPDKISMIRNMNLKELNKVRKKFNFENSATVILLPEENNEVR